MTATQAPTPGPLLKGDVVRGPNGQIETVKSANPDFVVLVSGSGYLPSLVTFIGRPDADGHIWRPISWAKEWQVSHLGMIKGPKGGILSAPIAARRGGYPTVRIGHPKRTRHVHAIVAETFLGEKPDGWHVAHQNGDPTDNRVINLRIVSARDNHLQKQEHGTQAHGETHHCAKLSAADVIEIRRCAGEGASALARRFCVSRGTVRDILSAKTWRSTNG